jgi:hypothetical protein
MSQIALPLGLAQADARVSTRILIGNANVDAIEALGRADTWPFRTAVLAGPPRSGKSLIARWFADLGQGESIDDAHHLPEIELFHRWNRAQESGRPLLIVDGRAPGAWRIALPDLASRIGAALHLQIDAPDDAMLADLLALHAEARGFTLDRAAAAYLVPRCERSHMGAEQLVGAIDRLSLERHVAPTLAVWRDALRELGGGSLDHTDDQPRLL